MTENLQGNPRPCRGFAIDAPAETFGDHEVDRHGEEHEGTRPARQSDPEAPTGIPNLSSDRSRNKHERASDNPQAHFHRFLPYGSEDDGDDQLRLGGVRVLGEVNGLKLADLRGDDGKSEPQRERPTGAREASATSATKLSPSRFPGSGVGLAESPEEDVALGPEPRAAVHDQVIRVVATDALVHVVGPDRFRVRLQGFSIV